MRTLQDWVGMAGNILKVLDSSKQYMTHVYTYWLDHVHYVHNPYWLDHVHYVHNPYWLDHVHYAHNPYWLDHVHYVHNPYWLDHVHYVHNPYWLDHVHYVHNLFCLLRLALITRTSRPDIIFGVCELVLLVLQV